ncbi:crinkler (CRN) family protein [Thraustotheca clavata]|uniref:Crinkler (CRN) family protein n=1 Tax=Thraustotheca clavata TaxID=74557 RepID=A0A1V9YTK7_9STRA|nr:crinkler (CRN) family protein [Thraustotheca clavata]
MRITWKLHKYITKESLNQNNRVHVLVEFSTPPALQGQNLILDNQKYAISKTMLVNPNNEIGFWEALRQYTTPITAHKIITLQLGVYFLGNRKFSLQLYVCECYPKLWDLCKELIDDGNLVKLGNPAIGKIYFSFLILLYLARLHNLFISGSQTDFDDVLDKSSTYNIVYSYLYFINLFGLNLIKLATYQYMRVWSYQELVKCQHGVYSDISMALVRNGYERLCGNARYVLQCAKDQCQQQLFDQAIALTDLEFLLQFREPRNSTMVQISNLLLH